MTVAGVSSPECRAVARVITSNPEDPVAPRKKKPLTRAKADVAHY